MSDEPRILIIAHTHNHETNATADDFRNLIIGDPETGRAGTIVQAVKQALLMDPELHTRLYVPLPPYEVEAAFAERGVHDGRSIPTWMAAVRLLMQHREAFGIPKRQRARLQMLLHEAYLDFWGDTPMPRRNTVTESQRAAEFAKREGYTVIQSVSTGYGHAARAAASDFGFADKQGIMAFGFAPQSFPGHKSEQSVVFDPTFLQDAAYSQIPRIHDWHVLLPGIFRALGAQGENAQPLAADIAELLKRYGVTTNTRGEAI